MQNAINQSAQLATAAAHNLQAAYPPPGKLAKLEKKFGAHLAFPPLEQETRPAVPTDQAAYYLNRKPQTLRAWACLENGPIRPVRVNGRLAWPIAGIRAVLNGEVA